jgi:hypothetical protein
MGHENAHPIPLFLVFRRVFREKLGDIHKKSRRWNCLPEQPSAAGVGL